MTTLQRRPFGDLLRAWRRRRAMSQMDLSLQASSSCRHLSFVENGRSRPSREMVVRLCRALQVPMRESNDLLLAAGFAPAHRESPLDRPALRAANAAIGLILRHHEPYPAVVMDRHWNLLRANGAARRLFAHLLGRGDEGAPANVVELVLAEDGLRPWIANWTEVAEALVDRVRREAVGGFVDGATQRLLDAAGRTLGASAVSDDGADAPPVVALKFRKGDLALDYFSMVTTLGTPRDIALQELRIECFFPANEETRRSVARDAVRRAVPPAPGSPARRAAGAGPRRPA